MPVDFPYFSWWDTHLVTERIGARKNTSNLERWISGTEKNHPVKRQSLIQRQPRVWTRREHTDGLWSLTNVSEWSRLMALVDLIGWKFNLCKRQKELAWQVVANQWYVCLKKWKLNTLQWRPTHIKIRVDKTKLTRPSPIYMFIVCFILTEASWELYNLYTIPASACVLFPAHFNVEYLRTAISVFQCLVTAPVWPDLFQLTISVLLLFFALAVTRDHWRHCYCSWRLLESAWLQPHKNLERLFHFCSFTSSRLNRRQRIGARTMVSIPSHLIPFYWLWLLFYPEKGIPVRVEFIFLKNARDFDINFSHTG